MSNMNCSFYLLRHAPSQHNLAKESWKKQYPNDSDYKERPEYATLKYSIDLIDPRVVAHTLIDEARKTIDLANTQLIICSPMRRCLQTCTQLLKDHDKQIKVVVQPLLSSRLNSAWSVGSSIKELKVEFPHFDYSSFAGIEDTWMLKLLERTRKIEINVIQENSHRTKHFMLEALANKNGESYFEFNERVKSLRTRIKAIIEEHQPMGQQSNVVIISHSCVLNFLTAKEFTEKGKVKNKESFQHCIPKKIKPALLLQPNDGDGQKAKL